jgi:hypothetical protein
LAQWSTKHWEKYYGRLPGPQYSNLGLPYAMSPIHGLQILHGIPVMFQENDSVGSGKVKTKSTHTRRQQQDVNRRVLQSHKRGE